MVEGWSGVLSQKMAEWLRRPFSEEEVMRAVMGPHGFPMAFQSSCWDVVLGLSNYSHSSIIDVLGYDIILHSLFFSVPTKLSLLALDLSLI